MGYFAFWRKLVSIDGFVRMEEQFTLLMLVCASVFVRLCVQFSSFLCIFCVILEFISPAQHRDSIRPRVHQFITRSCMMDRPNNDTAERYDLQYLRLTCVTEFAYQRLWYGIFDVDDAFVRGQ